MEDHLNIQQRVNWVILEALGCSPTQITPEASLVLDLGADSLDVVEIVMALEEEFDIGIPDSAAEGISRVQDAYAYIEKRVAGARNVGSQE